VEYIQLVVVMFVHQTGYDVRAVSDCGVHAGIGCSVHSVSACGLHGMSGFCELEDSDCGVHAVSNCSVSGAKAVVWIYQCNNWLSSEYTEYSKGHGHYMYALQQCTNMDTQVGMCPSSLEESNLQSQEAIPAAAGFN
jgi:hypothetical protein